ncbi:hypothetical protein WG66_001056, partial [Moniliophthora roreri]
MWGKPLLLSHSDAIQIEEEDAPLMFDRLPEKHTKNPRGSCLWKKTFETGSLVLSIVDCRLSIASVSEQLTLLLLLFFCLLFCRR